MNPTWPLGFALALVLGGVTACGGGSDKPSTTDAGTSDARTADASIDAAPAIDAGADAAQGAQAPGALVPAGGAAASPNYRFVGTLSSGGQAASAQHSVRTGVVGAAQ